MFTLFKSNTWNLPNLFIEHIPMLCTSCLFINFNQPISTRGTYYDTCWFRQQNIKTLTYKYIINKKTLNIQNITPILNVCKKLCLDLPELTF